MGRPWLYCSANLGSTLVSSPFKMLNRWWSKPRRLQSRNRTSTISQRSIASLPRYSVKRKRTSYPHTENTTIVYLSKRGRLHLLGLSINCHQSNSRSSRITLMTTSGKDSYVTLNPLVLRPFCLQQNQMEDYGYVSITVASTKLLSRNLTRYPQSDKFWRDLGVPNSSP